MGIDTELSSFPVLLALIELFEEYSGPMAEAEASTGHSYRFPQRQFYHRAVHRFCHPIVMIAATSGKYRKRYTYLPTIQIACAAD